METVTLDSSYSEEVKKEVWIAIEKMEDFSNPWVVIRVKNGKASVTIFGREELARKYVGKVNRKLSSEQLFCVQVAYQS